MQLMSVTDFIGGENPDAFEHLDDTPASYGGNSGKFVKVNDSADGLEFIEDDTRTTVNTFSASWEESADIQAVADDVAVVGAVSGDWNDTRTSLQTASGDWNESQSAVNSTSADWNDTRTSLQTTSADWNDTRTTLGSTSADWNDTRTSLQTTSADWNDHEQVYKQLVLTGTTLVQVYKQPALTGTTHEQVYKQLVLTGMNLNPLSAAQARIGTAFIHISTVSLAKD
jgi:hypothetical protein